MSRVYPTGGPAGIVGSDIVTEVEKFAGDPYVYGAAGPSTFDCSGLVQYVLLQLGVKNVPRTSETQWAWVKRISKSQLQPGDLVFAQFPGDNASPGHVGIYTGNGNVISAADPAQGVVQGPLSSWGDAVVGYGRVPGMASATGSPGGGGTSGGGGTAAPAAQPYANLGVGDVLAGMNGILHDVAIALDYIFGLFGRGQGWRLAFWAVAAVAAYISIRFFLATTPFQQQGLPA